MDWYLEVRIQAKDRRYSFYFFDPSDEGQKDAEKIDLNVPRHAQYLKSAWKKHQDAVYWLAIRKGLTFYQTRSNAIVLQGTLPAQKLSDWRLEKPYTKKYTCHLDLHQRYLYVTIGQKNWVQKLIINRKKLLDSHEKKLLDKQNSSNQSQPIPKPICDRSGQLVNKHEVFVDKGETSWSREIKEESSHEELCSSDRSGQPDITHSVIRAQTNLSGEIRVEQTHGRSGQPDKHEITLRAAPEVHREITTLNTDNELIRERIEEDMDFKIPGLPHSTVKQLQSAFVRELIQKIENHPNRHALQRDPQQNQSFNSFSQESKQMIHEVGNIELCELLDMEPKTRCKVCLSYWDIGIVYCTCGHFLREGTGD